MGALVAVGFLGVFTAGWFAAQPGLGAIADAVPWVGLSPAWRLAHRARSDRGTSRLRLSAFPPVRVRSERGVAAMVLFGVGYGAASLGCTLPIFLALIGASLGADKLAIFAAYGIGMAIVLMALAVAVACARQGLASRLRPLLPHVARLAAVLLMPPAGISSTTGRESGSATA